MANYQSTEQNVDSRSSPVKSDDSDIEKLSEYYENRDPFIVSHRL